MLTPSGRIWSTSLVLLAACSFLASQATAADDPQPQIGECHVGFDGTFKIGHWTPVWVDVTGRLGDAKLDVELTVVDSDGVELTVAAPAATSQPTLLYTRVGRLGSGMRVRLVADDGRVLDRVELAAASQQAGDASLTGLPSTGTLVLQIGSGDLGLPGVLVDPGMDGGATVGAVVELDDVAALPVDWFGYDGVDVVVLSTSDVEFCARLAADTRRFAALRQWLHLGGRVVLCVGRNAPRLLAADAPFAELVPGRFEELVRLPQTQSLETFATSRDAISRSGARQNIPLPLIVDVEGRVELFGRGDDLPILVRSARGLGEIAFLGIDLTDEPFSDWSGRTGLLRAVLQPYLPEVDASTIKQKIVSLGYDDLAGALRQRLGREFAGVSVIGFPLVAALIIGYLIWLGPLDYWFVDRVVRRPWIAWLTLPVIVLTTMSAAALLAGASKATKSPQINQAEVVDVDLSTGLVRGTCWSTLYSPRAEQFDVGLAPQLPTGLPATAAEALVSWLGLPGRGLGGMHAAGDPIDVTGVGYRQPRELNRLVEVPLLTAATKSFVAQWVDAAEEGGESPLDATLSLDADGLLTGSITNNTGHVLDDACLLSGSAGYRLGDLQPREQFTIGSGLSPLRTRSILARRVRRRAAGQPETFLANRASVDQLLGVMMFYHAIGGEGFAGLPNRYQSRLDLSRLLELDRAILVAQSPATGSQWIDTAKADSPNDESDTSTVIYRFIIPLTTND
jgi:hypothetical protein